MAGIFGLLGLGDTDRSYVRTIGQQIVYDAVNTYLQMHDEDMMASYAVFVAEQTSNHQERYKLPGGGRLQKRGGLAQSGAVKASGQWDVAYPLEDFGAQISMDDITLAYMTVQELQRHLDTVVLQDINTTRFEILRALFNNAARTYTDPIWGNLTVQPLANGDAVQYPPVLGTEVDATENHYLESGYLASAISNTNNPYPVIRNELEEHFGTPSGFGNVAVFINSAQVALTESLADYDQVVDNMLIPNQNRDIPQNLPSVPGRVIGRSNGVWVVEWRWIPSGWMVGIDLDNPAPLKVRVDPDDTGIESALTLVQTDRMYPLQNSHYRRRMGVGVANRLNGVVMELGNGGTYTIPAAYA
jgi:hypothetical protein